MLVTTRDGEEKHEGDATGESILSGFGSSCGSSTDETFDQEEFIAELTRNMAENMLQEDDENPTISHLTATNIPSQFHPNHDVQNIKGKKYMHQNEQHMRMKEYGNGSNRGGSGMKVVFLGEIGSKNGSSSGTGVFIPHATDNLPDHQPRKKPGRCPTVLIPERVLHTLKQHFEKRTGNQAHPNGVFHMNQNHKLQPQETSNKRVANNNVNNYQDLQLPQEWTY